MPLGPRIGLITACSFWAVSFVATTEALAVVPPLTVVAFDAGGAHRHWALREQGGELHWEVSSDGTAWTSLHQVALPLDPTLVRLEVMARNATAQAAVGTIEMDRLNGGTATGQACPTASQS